MKQLAIVVMLGVIGGNILTNAEQYNNARPIQYAQAEEAPRVILIGTTTKEKTIEEKIRDTFPEAPNTAVAIAKCESGLNPNAINNRNKNGTTDGGLMQINSIHDKYLDELGLDKFDVDDNLKFARLLYEERGFAPWVCYSKIK